MDPTTLGLTDVILAAGEQQKSFLTNESFWGSVATWGMWIIGTLTVLGSIGTDGMVVGVVKLIYRLPIALLGWAIIWFIIFMVGGLLGVASENMVNAPTPEDIEERSRQNCIMNNLPCDDLPELGVEPWP